MANYKITKNKHQSIEEDVLLFVSKTDPQTYVLVSGREYTQGQKSKDGDIYVIGYFNLNTNQVFTVTYSSFIEIYKRVTDCEITFNF